MEQPLYLNKNSLIVDVPMEDSKGGSWPEEGAAVTFSTGKIQLKRPDSFRAADSKNPHPLGGNPYWSEEFIAKLKGASGKYQEEKGDDDGYHLCIHVIDVQVEFEDTTYSKEVKVRVHGFLLDMLEELDSGKFHLKLEIGLEDYPQLDSVDMPVSSKVALEPLDIDDEHDDVCMKEKYFEGRFPGGSAFHRNWISEMRGFVNVILTRDKVISTDSNQMIGICRKILEGQIQTDITIVAMDGKGLGCNKSFLAAHSPVFASMFERTEMKEAESGQIEMVDMNEADVRAFLAYLYYMDLTAPRENSSIALKLLHAGHKYDIPHLEAEMKVIFNWQPAGWCDVQVALELFLFVRQLADYCCAAELKMKAVEVLKLKAGQLAIESWKELVVVGDKELVAEASFELFQLISSKEGAASKMD